MSRKKIIFFPPYQYKYFISAWKNTAVGASCGETIRWVFSIIRTHIVLVDFHAAKKITNFLKGDTVSTCNSFRFFSLGLILPFLKRVHFRFFMCVIKIDWHCIGRRNIERVGGLKENIWIVANATDQQGGFCKKPRRVRDRTATWYSISLGIHTQADSDGVSTATLETRHLKGWSSRTCGVVQRQCNICIWQVRKTTAP